ncbi:helix-turn-helix domain-containing protein [Flavonifractor hominis]|uniref:Helix-turn-helix transcriptional regulator n=1 Tax=Flavonifractor hominis TaxID=3133178 RepID=A0ABV1EME6_9FIRM
MLLFSEYLRDLLQAKKMTVSALSRLSGVERTALSKALAGQRVLPYDSLSSIIYHLRLTPAEGQRLRVYYDAQFEKEGIRRARELVGRLFVDLAELDFVTPAFEESQLLMDLTQYAAQRSIFSGVTNVQPLLRMVLTQELTRDDAQIALTVPPTDTFLIGELLRRYLDGRMNGEVRQIIAFDASGTAEDISLHNLECFCRILPICLLSRRTYHPYYYYDNTVAARYTDPFPYFLVTHSCVVCLSEDGEQAMLLQGADQVNCYRRHFQNLCSRCYNLIQYTTDPVEILASYDGCTDHDGFYMVMEQPCFGRFYDEAVIAAHLRSNLPFQDRLAQVARKRFAKLRTATRFYTLFSREGLERFSASGALDDFPTAFVAPFSPEERRWLMTALAEHIRSGDIVGRIFSQGVFPDYLSMTTSQRSGIGFFTTERFPLQRGFCSVQLREPNLCRAFHQWLLHLPVCEGVLSRDETAAVLEELARTLT